MIRNLIAACALGALAACSTTDGNSAGGTAGIAVTAADRSAFVGTWTGATPNGSQVLVSVPPSGNASYTFAGERVAVTNTSVSGNRMTLRNQFMSVTLTPSGDRMAYVWRSGSRSATATLSRD